LSTRRQFVSAALTGLTVKADRTIAGGFVYESQAQGHRLRDRAAFPAPKRSERVAVTIIGGGIAGLSAAWRLAKRGFRDFLVLEMESQAGGNARCGENEITAYPWAAHYVPVPNRHSTLVRELFEEFGALENGRWNERYLCHTPQERLFIHGRWQEGVEPAAYERREFHRFEERMRGFAATGAFSIPAQPQRFVELDRVSMADWLRRERFDSRYLRWYVDYACRDDYGARSHEVSAWAGVHYWASREHVEQGPLTWPEGNGWIARRLLERIGGRVRTGAMVHRIERAGLGYRVIAGDTIFHSDAVIFAAPLYLAPYLMEGAPDTGAFQYSPWLTANLTLEHWPRERGMEPAWDNTIYDSPALGYVVATHQSVRQHIDRTVWTYYWAPGDRRKLLAAGYLALREAILQDLSRPHPDIRQCVSRVDILRLGHAMIRPSVGFLFHTGRRKLAAPRGRLVFANSDLSGLSLFEEAQYRGVRAADHVLLELGRA
jgi:glycine/D-amino acid oxidase-like deaminating enzyme